MTRLARAPEFVGRSDPRLPRLVDPDPAVVKRSAEEPQPLTPQLPTLLVLHRLHARLCDRKRGGLAIRAEQAFMSCIECASAPMSAGRVVDRVRPATSPGSSSVLSVQTTPYAAASS